MIFLVLTGYNILKKNNRIRESNRGVDYANFYNNVFLGVKYQPYLLHRTNAIKNGIHPPCIHKHLKFKVNLLHSLE